MKRIWNLGQVAAFALDSAITAASSMGSCQVVGNAIRCTIDQLAAGQIGMVRVSLTPQFSGKLMISASLSSVPPEWRPIDNQAGSMIPVIPDVEECACSCSSNTPA